MAVLAVGLATLALRPIPASSSAFDELWGLPSEDELPGQLVIYFLDTGQSDAIYVRAPGGEVMVIDTGDAERPEQVASFLIAQKKITRIDALVLTHPHADHIGGALAVLDGLEVACVYHSGFPHPTPLHEDVLTRLGQLKGDGKLTCVEGRAGMTLDLGPELDVRLLHPVDPLGEDANESSLVVKITHGAFSALFTGDIGEESEQALIARGADLEATILKVAHHGSGASSREDFLAAVGSRLAVIEVGADNGYGHPSPSTIGRLQAAGARILRTDVDGTIIVHSDGQDWWVLTAAGG